MYLKSLELQGFKSFADKITLDFNAGITSVVGPNGSGKSNISDAVRWVLGEQSAKNLRGNKMEDVIFAGTEHRKPLGFAEVSITFDNSDKSLPIEYGEVTITRRVYRSGESEYFINKTSCRLKDIHELFLDTGIGLDGYSIIGQGRIEEILSAKSEDRRNIFEEASGIMKYKMRKLDAEKKLELTKQNLVRINDIISELEIQLEPLRMQSETARKYLSLRESLKEIEINVYIENISKIKEKIKEFEEEYQCLKDDIQQECLKLDSMNSQNQHKTNIIKQLEERLEKSRQEYYDLEGKLEKCHTEVRLNNEKISHLNQNSQRIGDEIRELEKKSDILDDEIKSKQERLEHLTDKFELHSAKLEEHSKKMELLMATLDENEKHIEKLKSGIMEKIDVQSDKKTQIGNVKIHIENIKKRKDTIDADIEQLKLESDREQMKKKELAANLQSIKEFLARANIEIKSLLSGRDERLILFEKLRKKKDEIKSEIQFKYSRHHMLKDMEKNLEGYSRSVKMILQACGRSEKLARGIHGALAQLIKVDARYETAIEMALGGALQNIVTSSEDDAKQAIEYLKANKLGRATFLPISSVKGRGFEDDISSQIKSMKGFCGFASELVEFDPQYDGIIKSLLGKVVVVENLDCGIAMARKFKYAFRIVTLEGDILNTGGSMSGGSRDTRGSGILGRSREIAELEERIQKLRNDEAELEKQCSDLSMQIKEMENEIYGIQAKIREYEMVRIRDESHLAQIEDNIKKCNAKIDMLEQEKIQLVRQEGEAERELGKYIEEYEAIDREITDTKQVILEYQEKHKEDRTARDKLNKDITDFKISVSSIKESIESVKESLVKIAAEKEDILNSIERKKMVINTNQNEVALLNQKNKELSGIILEIEKKKAGKAQEIENITEERKILEEELSYTIKQINDINNKIAILREECNKIELRKAKIEIEMEAMQNRMWDEYELTYTNALQFKKDIGSMAQAQKKINEIKNMIKELGPVNVAAIDEYIKVKERYEFMTMQRDDMQQAKEKLHKIIDEMVALMKIQFMQQFKLINENFESVFRELFDGGHARLILVNENDVLESDIEIEAQPPGKRLQNMMLLSGGEKALTAIALLFAILRLRPTPFCILDEIEAALDEANVARFAQYLKRYVNQTQFIVITHRKGTMEISDTLYGVTMQEHGVSKIVSIKMEDKAS